MNGTGKLVQRRAFGYKCLFEQDFLNLSTLDCEEPNLILILQAGEIRSYNLMRGQSYHNLTNEDVQAGRAAIVIPKTRKPLHDYVPLYLGFKTPMVAIYQAHNENLLFLRFSLDILAIPGVVVCDGDARSQSSKFYTFTGPDVFSKIDIAAVRTVKYAKDPELKRKKQAEILIPDKLQTNQLLILFAILKVPKLAPCPF
jgi:hypothetical protein